MHATLPLLEMTDFPPVTRGKLDTLQVNLGYICNQQCVHCHVNAGPRRKEIMQRDVIDDIIKYLKAAKDVVTLDLTGGAPELNPHFRELVETARNMGKRVIDRCNLTILEEPGQQGLAEFLADHEVEITASLPCYLEENVTAQRGKGVFAASIRALRKLNSLGYGQEDTGLKLNLVYNPQGPVLPPPQLSLQEDYKKHLGTTYGVVFNELFTITNMPIKRFGSMLISKGRFDDYMSLLRASYKESNLPSVMCRNLISIDWQGYVYDCDFNQMLNLPLRYGARPRTYIRDLINVDVEGLPVVVKDHCYGCTAGQGSSCGGAL
jgi:radical SAM/Cys-rich protein